MYLCYPEEKGNTRADKRGKCLFFHSSCNQKMLSLVVTFDFSTVQIYLPVQLSGFTPDVKVWEVCFDKSGNFQEVRRAFELKGHTAGIHWFAFSADSYRSVAILAICLSVTCFYANNCVSVYK